MLNFTQKQIIVGAFSLFIVVFVIYSNHFYNSFHFDDSHTIQNNPYITDLKYIPNFFTDAHTFSSLPANQSYRPMVSTTLAFDYFLSNGLTDTFYFHLTNWLFFILLGILLFYFFRKLIINAGFGDLANKVSVFSTAIYMVHPANAETVNYIIARSDIISTFFVVLAFVMYLYSPLCRKYYLYLLSVFIGALAKISAIMFFPLLFTYILFFENIESKIYSVANFLNAFKKNIPALLVCVFLYFFIRAMDSKTWTPGGTSVFNYAITQPLVILHYVQTFFVPLQLSADTDWEPLKLIDGWLPMAIGIVVGSLGVLLLVISAYFLSLKNDFRPAAFGIAWFLIALMPTSSFIPFAEVMNDHRMFFPFIGLGFAVVFVILKLSSKTPRASTYALPLLVTVIALFAYGTYQRNKVWLTEETLWKDVVEKSPLNGRGHMNYGLSQMEKGNYVEAEKHFKITIELWPYYAYAYVNMGILKNALNKTEEAETNFVKGLQYGQNYPFPDCYFYYAKFLAEHKRFSEAAPLLEKTIALYAEHVQANFMLLYVYEQLQEYDKLKQLAIKMAQWYTDNSAIQQYLTIANNRKAINELGKDNFINVKSEKYYIDICMLFFEKMQIDSVVDYGNKGIAAYKNSAELYNILGAAYNEQREWEKAVEVLKEAISINPGFALAQNNLKWAEMNLKQPEPTK